MTAIEDYLQCSYFPHFTSFHFKSIHLHSRFPLLLLYPADMAGITDSVVSKLKKQRSNGLNITPTKEALKLTMADPNGPLIYDMMANHSSLWRAKNLRPSILPPGWKMGISRLGRVPVYDPLHEPTPPQMVLEHPKPTAVIRRQGATAGVPPRYQATDPQFEFATDEYNLGLPPHLAQLYHDDMRRRGGVVDTPGGRPPFMPPGMSCRGQVPIMVDALVDADYLDDGMVDPGIDIPQRPPIRRVVPFSHHGIHRPGHHHRHRPVHGHNHEVLRPDHIEQDIRISNHAQRMDRRNAELEHDVDLEAAVIAQQQREIDIAEQRRREEHVRLHQERLARQEEHARLHEEELRRRQAEENLARREEQLEATEAELLAEEIRHREHQEPQRHGYGHGHGHRETCRIVRDRDGRAVMVDDHPIQQHRELIRVPAHNPHHSHHGHQHHSPPRHHPSVVRQTRQARHVHFADALDTPEEERIAHHHERVRQEAYPLPRRRRFDRERSPYHYLEDDLGEFARDEFNGSTDGNYLPLKRLLMSPQHRRQRGDWWEDAEWESGDDD